jgi:SAM-dependent methyltransferase
MYHNLAHLYAWSGVLDLSRHLLAATEAAFSQYNIHRPGPVLDLGCGTGTFTLMLAATGWQVVGVDRAEPMLTIAKDREKSGEILRELTQDRRDEGLAVPESLQPLNNIKPVRWCSGDLTALQTTLESLPTEFTPFQAVTCFDDTLNHLSDINALTLGIQGVGQALSPGGLFLFDLNTLENYTQLWDGKDQDELPNARLTFDSSYDPAAQRAKTDIQAEEFQEDGSLRVQEETVHQCYFDESTVSKILSAQGFQVLSQQPFDPFRLLTDGDAIKTLWITQKESP